jgi:hypothetical protein
MDAVFLNKRFHGIVPTPEGEVLDAMFFVLEDFFLEGGDVGFAPVIGNAGQPEPFDHFGAGCGATLFRIEGNDAPGDKPIAMKVGSIGVIRVIGCQCGRGGNQQAAKCRKCRAARELSHGESFGKFKEEKQSAHSRRG